MTKKRSYWPLAIIITLSLFATFIITIAVFLSGKNFDLVTENYYEESLLYEDKIDMLSNTSKLDSLPELHYRLGGKSLLVSFPNNYAGVIDSGAVIFYNSQNSGLDFEENLNLNEFGQQLFKEEQIKGNRWTVSLKWSMKGMHYLWEKEIKL